MKFIELLALCMCVHIHIKMELTVECQSAEISDDNKVPKFDHEDEHKSPENNVSNRITD